MKNLFAVTLGVLTAIGGFVDIGDLVANSQAGSRFGMSLAWVVVVGVLGICVYAEMAGRVAAISGRPVFDLVRERLGPRAGLLNLAGSYLVTVLTLGAEIGGVAIAVQLATSVHYLLVVPVAAFACWVVLWRVRFGTMERVLGVRLEDLGQTALPVAMGLGRLGLAVAILGFFAATFGAALETGLSAGYTVAQYFGWSWGKRRKPREAARFHVVVLVSVLLGTAALATTIDPVLLTQITLVLSAVVLPLTYLPILVVANDRQYLGEHVNGRLGNAIGVLYLFVILVVAAAAIPLMIMTGMGG